MKIIITAAGDGRRWKNHLGIRKQFAVINGERIIDRIIRLFSDLGEIIVITKKGSEVPGVNNVYHTPELRYRGIDKLNSTVPYWNVEGDGRTLVLLGDVYWTDNGARILREAIEKAETERQWFLCGRLGKSNIPGRDWSFNENFALYFTMSDHENFLRAIDRSVELVNQGLIRRNRMAQWYRIACGKDGYDADWREQPQQNLGHFVEVNDFTDDIDYGKDYQPLKNAIEQ